MGCLNSYAYFIPFGSPLPIVSIKIGYNVDMFDAAGVEYPSSTEAMSQEEFVQMLADLKEGLLASDETNSYGQAYKDCFTNSMDAAILWDSLSWPIVKSFGGTIFDEEGNHLDEEGNMLFDSEEPIRRCASRTTSSPTATWGTPVPGARGTARSF